MKKTVKLVLAITILSLGYWFTIHEDNFTTLVNTTLDLEDSLVSHSPLQYFTPQVFKMADSLQWNRAYKTSTEVFQSVFRSNNLQIEEQIYGLNQMLFNAVILDQLERTDILLQKIDSLLKGKELTEAKLADYYLGRGLHYAKKREATKGIKALKKALSYYRKDIPWAQSRRVLALSELALIYKYNTFQVDSFLHFADQAYEQHTKIAEWHPHASSVYYTKAHASWIRRAHAAGENLCDLAIVAARETDQIDSIWLARCMSLKGRFMRKEASKQLVAEKILIAAQQLSQSSHQASLTRQIPLQNLIAHFARKKDSSYVFQQLDNFQKEYSSEHWQYVDPAQIKGLYYAHTKQPKKSIQWYRVFLDRYQKRSSQESSLVDEAYFWIATNHQRLGQLEVAERAIWEMIAVRLGKSPAELDWEDLFDKNNALKLHVYVGYHFLANNYLLKFEQQQGGKEVLDRAFQLYQFIDTLVYANIDSFDEDAWLSATKMYNTKIYKSAIRVCYLLHQLSPKTELLEWANHFMERLKSILFFQEYALRLNTSANSSLDSLLIQEKEIKRQIRQLKQAGKGKDKMAYSELLEIQDRLNHQLSTSYPLFYQLKVRQGFMKLDSLQERLEQDTLTVLSYLEAMPYYYLLFIQSDTVIFTQIKEADSLVTQVNWLGKYLAGDENTFKRSHVKNFKKKAYAVFESLIAPISSFLNSPNSLLIVPDGALYTLPFEVLISDTTSRYRKNFADFPYLIKSHDVSYVFSLKSWLYHHYSPAPFTAPSVLGYAFSEAGDAIAGLLRSEANGQAIPGTGTELKAIEQAFAHSNNKIKLRYDKAANLQQFLKDIRQQDYDILHLALHARSAPSNRLNHVIYFPGNPLDSIYAYQLMNESLDARLVVLAACQTASGTFEAGEGVYSLSRAFLLAGAKSVIASFWEIDDHSTSKIIDLFYKQLSKGFTVNKALAAAKRDYLQQATSYQAHPFFWSGLCYVRA